ncbi:MAG: hypothetical protein ACTHQ3_18985 [Motilibacteraceae bacterium]
MPPRLRQPTWPAWTYYPSNGRPLPWALDLVDAVQAVGPTIDSEHSAGLRSDAVLAALAPGLTALGYHVEAGKSAADKIRRPVLFGEQGVETVTYEVDAVHDELGVVVEVEAGRGARSNATYRDLIRTSLIVDAQHLALLVPNIYRVRSAGREIQVPAYREARDLLTALYASQRLHLPFAGVLLLGY